MMFATPFPAVRAATGFGGLLFAAWAGVSPATAQDQEANPALHVELNKMEDDGAGGCRLSFVFRNETKDLYETLKLDLVMFGRDDVIARRLIVDASPMRPGKTTVKLFDVEGLPCADTATVLLNDLPACVVDGEGRSDCIEAITVNSRASAALTK